MVATGFLRIDIGGFGGIGITETGLGLLRGEGEFLYREDTVIARTPAKAREARAAREDAPETPLADEDTALLGALKALRLEIAREREVPAYIVFPDRSLIDMVRRRPRTEAEFAEVNGVGAAKLKEFAGPIPGRHRGRAGGAGGGGAAPREGAP